MWGILKILTLLFINQVIWWDFKHGYFNLKDQTSTIELMQISLISFVESSNFLTPFHDLFDFTWKILKIIDCIVSMKENYSLKLIEVRKDYAVSLDYIEYSLITLDFLTVLASKIAPFYSNSTYYETYDWAQYLKKMRCQQNFNHRSHFLLYFLAQTFQILDSVQFTLLLTAKCIL